MQLRNGTAKAHRLIGVMAFIASICPKCHRESKRESERMILINRRRGRVLDVYMNKHTP